MLQNYFEVMIGELQLFSSFPPVPPRYASYPVSFKRIQLLMIKADHKEIVEYIKISALCKMYMQDNLRLLLIYGSSNTCRPGEAITINNKDKIKEEMLCIFII